MSEPLRTPPHDPNAAYGAADERGRPTIRPGSEDPLEELARILGEGAAHPVRPEQIVEVGRRANPGGRAMPQQVSELEAQLFEELRSSVAPEERVRGDFEREMPPIIPQHPVDDHDIASLRHITAPGGAEPTVEGFAQAATQPADAPDPRWADYYAYDDGIAAGSYDPAFDHGAAPAPVAAAPAVAPTGAQPIDFDHAFAAEIHRVVRGAEAPRPTFDDFDQVAIATAAREASPYVTSEPVIAPHSQRETWEAEHLPHEKSRSGFKIAAALVILVGGGIAAVAGWKTWGDKIIGPSGPVLVRADGKPFKVQPDPSKAPVADDEPTLKKDTSVAGSKIVSLQEEPVDQVSGRTPEGREVRVINPGAQRGQSNDVPHTVKTVVVRPDGSIVSDGTQVRPPNPAKAGGDAPVAPVAAPTPAPAAESKPTLPPVAVSAPIPTPAPAPAGEPSIAVLATKPTAVPPPAAAMPQPQVTTVATKPVVPTPPPVPTASVPKPPVPAAPPAPKPVATTTVTPPPAQPAAGAPLSLGPVAPKLAATTPAPAPQAAPAAKPAAAPVALAPPPPTAAPATGGGGDWAVQISASKSDAEARRSFSDAQKRYSALAGKSLDVQQANLGDKGTFYRARVPAGSRDQAAALCQQIQAQGGQCMVVKR